MKTGDTEPRTNPKWQDRMSTLFQRVWRKTETLGEEGDKRMPPSKTHAVSIPCKETKLTGTSFDRFVGQNPRAAVDFWANWCRPCRALSPILESTAKNMEPEVCVGKVNIDHEPSLARKYHVKSIPMVILFREGKIVGRIEGVLPPATFRTKMERALGN